MKKLGNKVWRSTIGLGLVALAFGLNACDNGTPPNPPPPTTAVLKRASKSSAIAITGDDKYVVAVNPENDSISVFRTTGWGSNRRTRKSLLSHNHSLINNGQLSTINC